MTSLFVSEAAAAKMLGRDVSWLRANAATLEVQFGFPKVDLAIGRRHKEAIEVWARGRNIDRQKFPEQTDEDSKGTNFDEF